MPTDVIVLNGASSSGKTSIARKLLEILPGTWLTLGVDDLLHALGEPAGGDAPIDITADGDVVVRTSFPRIEEAWWAGVASMARAGIGVVIEDVFLGGGASQARLRAALSGLDVLWVGVRCPVEVAVRREAGRADRIEGMAASQAGPVHDGVSYDLEVDTAATSTSWCAETVAARVDVGPRVGSGRPVIVDCDPSWPSRATTLADSLSGRLGPFARRVDHIGSTAIPGMAAKEVLDLQISVDDLAASTEAFESPLRALGFERSAITADHVPRGGPGSHPGPWEKRLWMRRDHPEGDVNLHVRQTGSPNERFALLFRDWFRAHPAAVPAYAAFKRSLAALADDTAAYSDVKDPVVDLVISVAEDWAAATGWRPSRA